MNDQEVIDAIKSGERAKQQQAMDYVYAQHHGPISAYLKKSIIDRDYPGRDEEALDCVVDAIIAFRDNIVFGRLAKLESAKIRSYLITIAKRKHQRRRKKAQKENDSRWLVPPIDEGVEEASLQRLRHCIDKLEDNCRELVTFFYLQGLKMDEVIQETAKTYTNAASARVALQRCRARLRKCMDSPSLQ